MKGSTISDKEQESFYIYILYIILKYNLNNLRSKHKT